MKPAILKRLMLLWLFAVPAIVLPVRAAELTARITLLLSSDMDVHLQAMQGFRQRLDEYENITAVLDVKQLDDENPLDKVDIAGSDSQLIIAIGSRATGKVVEADLDIPVLSIVTPKVTFDALLGASKPASNRYNSGILAGIVLDQPPSRRLRLTRMLLADSNKVGILWGPVSRQESAEYQAAARTAGLELNMATVDDEVNPIPLIEGLIGGNDALLAVYDSVALNPRTAKWLLYLAYQNRVPVIGFSRAYVDAGALAAVYSTPEQIGRQAAEVVHEYFSANSGSLPARLYPKYFSLGLNRSVARSIGLSLPDEDWLLEQLMQAEQGRQTQ